MTIKFTKDLPAETRYSYKKGDTVKDAETIFGKAQTEYFLEQGTAEPVKGSTETATTKAKTETATSK